MSSDDDATVASPFSPRTQRELASTIVIPPPPEAQAAFSLGNQIQRELAQKKIIVSPQVTAHWKKAATLGHVDATHALGVHALQEGHYSLAFEYLKKAADVGHTDSCYQVGRMLLHGDGIPQDVPQGLVYLQRAAEKQYTKAHRALGLYYATDEQARHETKAIEHFKVAIAHRDFSAHRELGDLYHATDQLELAAQQYKVAVQCGDREAARKLGMCYINGCCVKSNPERAGELLVEAGDQFSYVANFEIAERFEVGRGVARDYTAAVMFYQFAWELAVEDGRDLEAIHAAETALLRLEAPFDANAGLVKNTMLRWIHHLAAIGDRELQDKKMC